MPYGKQKYDSKEDVFYCEFPIFEDDGTYQICNKKCRDLVRHITRAHGILADEYKKMLGLNKNESLMSKKTTNRLRNNPNVQKGWSNLKPQKFKKGDNTIQSYERSPQEKERLRKLHTLRKSPRFNKGKLKKTP